MPVEVSHNKEIPGINRLHVKVGLMAASTMGRDVRAGGLCLGHG